MSRQPEPVLATATHQEIAAQLDVARTLNATGHAGAALLLAWSCLEALARTALGTRMSTPQRPGSVLETLAFEGFVAPSEADRIRPLIAKRNRLAHGDLSVRLSPMEIEDFLQTISGALEVAQTPEPAST